MQTENLITTALQKLGMNQTQLAKELGVTQATVSRWENGKIKKVGPLAQRVIERLLEERAA